MSLVNRKRVAKSGKNILSGKAPGRLLRCTFHFITTELIITGRSIKTWPLLKAEVRK